MIKGTRISIHALVKRATIKNIWNTVHSLNFNPRPREEGDNPIYGRYKKYLISIHALVKRATRLRTQATTQRLHFNPRPREEGDRTAFHDTLNLCYFNPRPREEGDTAKEFTLDDFSHISIHALVKRATV